MKNNKYYEYKAVLIGKFALYRYTYMRLAMKEELKKMIDSDTLFMHLKDVEKTMCAYMNFYINKIVYSDDFKHSDDKNKILEHLSAKEEERVGNMWICVKNPYENEDFCKWSIASGISEEIKTAF